MATYNTPGSKAAKAQRRRARAALREQYNTSSDHEATMRFLADLKAQAKDIGEAYKAEQEK